jgi:4-deoxy-L-threo-5-hexosulose-uronate ketol-isomerase
MEVRHLPNQEAYQRMTTDELRRAFVANDLFSPGSISTLYVDADRAIIGGAMPTTQPLQLLATQKELAAEYFAERREAGVVNIGGAGNVLTDATVHTLNTKDMLYIGRGVKKIEFSTANPKEPAAFFIVSFPAHAAYPTAFIPAASAEKVQLGTSEQANKRTISKYIHAGGAKSCQLVMGLTDLEPGSVWNTMPPHTHLRRMEVYLYFGLDPDSVVVHLMGQPDKSRSIILRNREAVISPVWSIHCGAGTRSYSFIWAMGGENQEFTDMDQVSMPELF